MLRHKILGELHKSLVDSVRDSTQTSELYPVDSLIEGIRQRVANHLNFLAVRWLYVMKTRQAVVQKADKVQDKMNFAIAGSLEACLAIHV